jgi:hypothetical protein
MATVRYPPRHVQKVLALEAPGGEPDRVLAVLPTVTAPGRPVRLRVAVADAMGYPSLACGEAVRVRGPFVGGGEIVVPFEKGRPAVAAVEGVVLAADGLVRAEADLAGRAFPANPTLATRRPHAPVWWGDPHVHTVLSRCHAERCRSAEFCYAAARHFAGLDWASAADHVSNGRGDLGKWKESAAAGDRHDDPPAFVTVPAYEASLDGGAGGDNNVYMRRWPPTFVDEFEGGNVRTLCRKMRDMLPEADFFVVPHHTTRTGKHGEVPDSIYPGPDLMPVLEIHSKWGTSEYRGNPNPLKKVHPGPAYAVDLLGRGLRLGFIGGTDTHATMPAGFGHDHLDRLPGLTAAFAPARSRDAVFDAVRGRRCYATSLERIYLDVSVAGAGMGQVVSWPDAGAPREVRATAAAQSDITAIEVVRCGRTVHRAAVGAWRGEVRWVDEARLEEAALESPHLGRFVYYYVRVTCASGAQAWSSPVWIQKATE